VCHLIEIEHYICHVRQKKWRMSCSKTVQRKRLLTFTRKESFMETSMNRNRSQSSPSSQIKRGISDSSSAVSQVKSQVSDWASSVADSASDYVKTGTQFVEKNPARSIGIAAAAGAAIGCLLTLAICRE
jgi:ElaB/YqjD/DUF883 family membrane-anchored ribosome-binding protein